MAGISAVSFCGLVFLVLLIILLRSYVGYNKIDEKYGKPYMAKLIKMMGGHPELKQGSMAITFHSKNAIAFNRKVFLFSQINSIKIIAQLPNKFKNAQKTSVNSGMDEQYLCIALTDEYGEHEVVFTAESDFKEVADQLIKKWNKYNLLS